MPSTASRWLKGCGIGCGLVVLVVILLWVASCLYVKETFRGIEQAIESHQELVDRFGESDEFVPPADGTIAADRVERFLAVRESMAEHQAAVEAVLAEIPAGPIEDGGEVARVLMKLFGTLADLASTGGHYVDGRNRALLEQEMGLGEYLYIYSLAYYSWLGFAPTDGPERVVDGQRQRLLAGDEDEFEDAICAPRSLKRRWRRYMLAVLDNQLAALPAAPGDPWHEQLAAEIERFKDDPEHVPWQDGLPPPIVASLAPYQDRIPATYSPTCNCFEWPPEERQMRWNWAD